MIRIPVAVIVTALALSTGCQSNDQNMRADAGDAGSIYRDPSGRYRDRDTSTDQRDYQRSVDTTGFVQDDYYGEADEPVNRRDGVYAYPHDSRMEDGNYQHGDRTKGFTQDDYYGDPRPRIESRDDRYATPRDTVYDPNYPDHRRDVYPAQPRDENLPNHPRDNR